MESRRGRFGPRGLLRRAPDLARHQRDQACQYSQIIGLVDHRARILKKGDVLFNLEAMKMEYSLNSPRDGIINKIYVKNGQQVTEKMKLLSLKK